MRIRISRRDKVIQSTIVRSGVRARSSRNMMSNEMYVITAGLTNVYTKDETDTKIQDALSGISNGISSESPVGAINGINTNFVLVNTPTSGAKLYMNGIRLKETIDYTRSSNIVTFVSPPVPGDLLLADYNY